MVSNTRLTLNLQYPNIAQVAYAMQGDRLSRAVVADLIDGSTPWAPPAGAYGLITASKPDGTFAVYDTLEDGSPAIVIDGSTMTLYLAEQVLADAGAVKMSVAFFTAAGARLTTFRWTEVVAPEAVLDRVVSGNYISILTAAMTQAANDLEEAQAIFDQIKAAYGAPLTADTAAAMTDTSRVYVYTGTTGGGFTYGHWYYYNGTAWTDGGVYNSTAFETDPTLTIAGAAADAKATGDAIGDLKSAIYGGSASISADRFTPINFSINTGNKWTTLSGRSTAGVYDISECKKIVITPRAGVTNVWAFLNTATASDGAVPDFSDGYQGRITGNTSTPVEYVITGNMHYLYVLKTGSTGSNVYPESIEMDFKIITDSTLTEQYIPADAKATGAVRDSLLPVYSNLNPFGVMPLDGWRQGTYNASGEYSTHNRRVTSDYIAVKGGSLFLPEFHTAEKSFAFHCNFFTSEKTFISMESADHTPTNPNGYVVCPENTAYISVTLRPSPDTENITPTDIVYCGIRLVMQTFPQKNVDLSVMTYNVGHWGYGTASGIPSDIYDEKLLNLRHFFAKEKADVIGMQEFNGDIDREGTIRTNNVLFDALYPYKQDTGMWESIKSKYPFAFSGNAQMTDDRWYSYALTQIGDKQIYLLCVHLIPNLNHEDRSADRLAEAQEIVSMIKTGDSFNYSTIIFGDFNPEPGEEDALYKVFTDAGMSIANCGWFGKMFTAATNRTDLETGIATGKVWYIDNVIVTPDISIVNANPLYVYSDLVSDHIPLKVDLSFT